MQGGSWANGNPNRGLSNLEIRFHCYRGHRFHAHCSPWDSSRPATTIYVSQATRMGEMGGSGRDEEASSTANCCPHRCCCCCEGRYTCYSPCGGRGNERGFDDGHYRHGNYYKAAAARHSEQTYCCCSGEGETHFPTRPTSQNPSG